MSRPVFRRSKRTTTSEADGARETKRGGRSRAQVGLIGIVVTALVVVVALQMDKLPLLSPVSTYSAYFDDAGGLVKGDVVTLAGVQVGTVESLALSRTGQGTKVQIGFRMQDTVRMGIDTRAAIKTETVLGRRNLTIMPDGPGRIEPGGEIPNENTLAPYSLTDALDDATTSLDETDTDTLDQALGALADTFSETPQEVRGAVDGVARLSKSVADRDNTLRELLAKANQVSAIVSDRSKQINQLLVDANSLLGELQIRRQAIAELISGTRDVTRQISGFIAENNEQLQPVLTKLTSVLNILTENEDSLKRGIDNLGPYANLLGEAVASGPYFSSLVGIPTFGDYTNVFMKILQQKYPEVWDAFKRTGQPILPNAWGPGGDPKTGQLPPAPKPTYPTPAPPTSQPPSTQRPGR